MGRKKASRPGRLPASRDAGDNSVALAAFEVRLSQAERGAQLGAFGRGDPEDDDGDDSDHGNSWIVPDDHDVIIIDDEDDERENDQARFNSADMAALDGEEVEPKRPAPQPGNLLREACCINLQNPDDASPDEDAGVPLAVVQLDFYKSLGNDVVLFYKSSKQGAREEEEGQEDKGVHAPVDFGTPDDGALEMFLVRGLADEHLALSIRRGGMERFRGIASYWMGGTENQLEALAELVTRGDLHVRCKTVSRGDRQALHYEISLPRENLLETRMQAILAKLPTFQNLTWSIRPILVFFEWIFPGSVSTVSADWERIAALGPNSKAPAPFSAAAKLGALVDPARLFYAIRPSQTRAQLEAQYLPQGLNASLRPYQSRAVRWMLEHEGLVSDRAADRVQANILSAIFGDYMAADGTEIQFCPFNGAMCQPSANTKLDEDQRGSLGAFATGGILADEMGLGKTVEVITLVLAHRAANARLFSPLIDPFQTRALGSPQNTDNEDLVCVCNLPEAQLPGGTVQCHFCGQWQHLLCSLSYSKTQANPLNLEETVHVCLSCRATRNGDHQPPIKGTLIVCPVSIAAQWLSEIDHHTSSGTLKVLMYEGVRAIRSNLERALRVVCDLHNKILKSPARAADLEPQLQAAIRTYETAVAPLWPQYLATFDVIVTTYSVLRLEVHHVQTATRQRADERFHLRRKKRYFSPPSPLTSVTWFRVCLDEAQEVESSAAAAAEMAKNLQARFRWCVTGTPVGKHGLDDLFGLLLFLRVPVLSDPAWWNAAVVQPLAGKRRGAFRRLATAFQGILWRNTKETVQEELRLPSLTEHIHRLEFTAIEAHFYRNQHVAVANLASEGSRGARANGAPAPSAGKQQKKSTLETAMPHLLRLRQACCHPQIGSFGLRDGGHAGRGRRKRARRIGAGQDASIGAAAHVERGRSADAPMTMEEIYKQLVNKAKLECEESQRLLLMNTNATAGLRLLKNEPSKAREIYQRALALMNKHEKEGVCKTDSLQRLHTLEALRHIHALGLQDDSVSSNSNTGDHQGVSENLAQGASTTNAQGAGSNKLTATLHLARMDKEIKDIRDRFMARYETDVKVSLHSFTNRMQAVKQTPKECETWWILALSAIENAPDGESRSSILVDRVRMDKNSGGALQKRQDSLVFQFGSLEGMRIVLTREMQKLNTARQTVERATAKMGETPSLKEIHESAECSVCRYYFGKTGPMCRHCRIKKDFVVFENLLFTFERSKRDQAALQDATSGEGDASNYQFRHASELVLMLRIIKSAARSVRDAPGLDEIIDNADAHLNQLESLSSELSAAWDVWQKRDQWLKAFDELEMATMRMRLQLPGEAIEADEDQWKIRPEELEARLQVYEHECARYRSQLNQCLSQLKYLASINGSDSEGAKKTDSQGGHRLGTSVTTSTRADGGVDNECCPICHDPFGSEFAMLLCGHTLCVTCIDKLLRFSKKCPNCRAKFRKEDVRYVTRRKSVSPATGSSSSSSSSSSSPSTGVEAHNGASSSAAQDSSATTSTTTTTRLKKSGFGTKFDAVVEEILRVEANSPDEKCILFSQWDEVLGILEHAFRVNDVSHVRIKGRAKYDERLALFRRDPSVRVMLMNLSFGSRGLNVTEASHVFLVEPIMNPAIEAQAIGRIHRMGQTRPTHVHRFLVRNTVEERIHKLFRRKRLEALSHEGDGGEATDIDLTGDGDDNPKAGVIPPGEQTREGADQEYKTAGILSNEREELSEKELQELFC
ncbi:E3 ubiquitin-protein ligase SHPRH [Hondaea fermentalgiana]|uniref:E3 ubiquitin-protein ligase SHPRH n=1 Tax=Hondaea fermentalgiana TaxID=2315210 RepID=A0A2R5GD12_9STRA|nr:E3 ubiquitin-protein ligase SHPRH [Hondaea fermentalgiana]|eukprot:GBG28199.1 E3 ubiquitin-protein ligase SHPRH [Hondaea fermentalgiana]